jgi:hypothetical protein
MIKKVLQTGELDFCQRDRPIPEALAKFLQVHNEEFRLTYGRGSLRYNDLPYLSLVKIGDNGEDLITSERIDRSLATSFSICENITRFMFLSNILDVSHLDKHSSSYMKTLKFWFSMVLLGLWEKHAKKALCTNFYFSMMSLDSLEQWKINLPNYNPDIYYLKDYNYIQVKPDTLFVGTIQRKLDTFLRRKNHGTRYEMAFSVVQGLKRGFPTISDEIMDKAVQETLELLSTKKETPPHILNRIRDDCSYLFRNFFDNLEYDAKDSAPCHIKGSSSWLYTTRKGGAFRSLVDLFTTSDYYFNDSCEPLHHLISRIRTEEISFSSKLNYSFAGMIEIKGQVRSVYSPMTYLDFKSFIHDCIKDGRYLDDLIPHHQRVISLAEPLKARIISCGCAERNVLYKPCQVALLKCLKQFRAFQLTHIADVPEVVFKYFVKNKFEEGQIYVSGDYDATTNRLHSDCSVAALDGIFRYHKKDNVYKGMIDSLVGTTLHSIKYDEVNKVSIDKVVQQENGQLMGCIISFPLLCAINYAITRYVLDLSHKDMNRGTLINGDDILFPVKDEAQYNLWAKLTSEAGLVPSQGKNYCSRKFCMINSRMFSIENGLPSFVPYINMGLYMGVPRSQDFEEVKFYRLNCVREIMNHTWPKNINVELLQSLRHNRSCNQIVIANKDNPFWNEPINMSKFNLISCGSLCRCKSCMEKPSLYAKLIETYDRPEYKNYFDKKELSLSKYRPSTCYYLTNRGMDILKKNLEGSLRFKKLGKLTDKEQLRKNYLETSISKIRDFLPDIPLIERFEGFVNKLKPLRRSSLELYWRSHLNTCEMFAGQFFKWATL